MTLYKWMSDSDINIYVFGLWSLFITALFKYFYAALHDFIFVGCTFSTQLKMVIYVATAALLPFLIKIVKDSGAFKKFMRKFVRRTANKDIFDDVIDYKHSTCLSMYMKNSNILYVGNFLLKEEKLNDPYIVLSNYVIMDKNDYSFISSEEPNETGLVMINLRDVEFIEIDHEEGSEFLKALKGSGGSNK